MHGCGVVAHVSQEIITPHIYDATAEWCRYNSPYSYGRGACIGRILSAGIYATECNFVCTARSRYHEARLGTSRRWNEELGSGLGRLCAPSSEAAMEHVRKRADCS